MNEHPARLVLDGGRFSAWTRCPNCGLDAVHPIRPPQPRDPDEPNELVFEPEETVIESFGAGPRRVTVRHRPARIHESNFEAIRTCTKCRTEWGNT